MKKLTVFLLSFTLSTHINAAAGDLVPRSSLRDEIASLSLATKQGVTRYLEFWASWCAPCQEYLPQIAERQDDPGGTQFEVIVISIDEDIEATKRFSKRDAVNYRVLSDPKGEVARLYDLPGASASFVIDESGQITSRHTVLNNDDMQKIRAHIASLLDKSSSPECVAQ